MANPMAIPYEQARNLIQDGDIVFMAKRNGPLSWAIDFFTGGSYSHVNIAFWVETNGIKRLVAVEAQGSSHRRIINLSNYLFFKKAEMHVVTPPKAWTNVADVALEKLGEAKYGYFEAMYVGLREFLMQRLGIKLSERDTSGEICSEFVAKVYGLPDTLISPNALYTELMKTQQVRVVILKP